MFVLRYVVDSLFMLMVLLFFEIFIFLFLDIDVLIFRLIWFDLGVFLFFVCI